VTRSTTRWAVVVSEVLAPWVLAAVMPVLIAVATTTPLWRGVLTGLLVTLVCAVVPYTVVAIGVRRGRYEDHHVRNREDRPKLMAMVAGLTVLTAGLLVLIDASPASLVLLGLMTSCALVGFAVSRFWKISLHAMVATASSVVVVGFFPAWFPVLLAVPLVALARVRVRAHSPAQVVAGSGVGAVLAAVAVVLATG
jgi:membrane-associated phospholipid phosphatase